MTARPPAPRFSSLSRDSRGFVDREEAVSAFDLVMRALGEMPAVINVTGVGGIGKSRLLRELADRLSSQSIVASLDLESPALSQPDAALLALRAQLSSQEVNFGDFDLAYAVWWQRTNPHRRLERAQLPLIEESEMLSGLIDAISGVPIVGTAFNLLRAADRVTGSTRKWIRLRRRDVLRGLDERPSDELFDALTFFFAEAVRSAATERRRPAVLFIDSYEALHPHSRSRAYRTADRFLRDLSAQLAGGLVSVASRESLRWAEEDAAWEEMVHQCPLDVLPWSARLELLDSVDMADDLRLRIADASEGLPFYLQLAIDHFEQGKDLERATTQREILDLFLEHVDPSVLGILRVVSLLRVISDTVITHLMEVLDLHDAQWRWPEVRRYSFFAHVDEDTVTMHRLMVAALSEQISAEEARRVHSAAADAWQRVMSDTEVSPEFFDQACREFLFHRCQGGELDPATLLGVTDQLQHNARLGVIEGVIHDLEEAGVTRSKDTGLLLATRCIEAELGIITGAPERSCALLALPIEKAPTSGAGQAALDRLTLAGSHGLRVIGSTEQAYHGYSLLESSASPSVRRQATLWRADLDMARGRFQSALTLCDRLESMVKDDLELIADTHRLRYLAHRWSFRFDRAAAKLAHARAAYEEAGSKLGSVNVLTNTVELAAWVDPEECLRTADTALAAQRELGALHEIGKTTTAVALAHLLRDDLEAADLAVAGAIDTLERARYRSGRARAILVKAYITARRGEHARSVTLAQSCAAELTTASVYPTLIWLACLLQADLGHGQDIESQIQVAIDAIEPAEDDTQMAQRVLWVHSRLRGA